MNAPRRRSPYVEVPAGNRAVAANITRLRLAAGWTQEQLGEKLGWSPANVSSAERSAVAGRDKRRFDADVIVLIAAIFGVPPAALITPPGAGPPLCGCCQGEPPAGMRCQLCGADGPQFDGSGGAA